MGREDAQERNHPEPEVSRQKQACSLCPAVQLCFLAHKKATHLESPWWLSGLQTQLVDAGSIPGLAQWVKDPIWCCYELWCRLRTWLGSGVALAVVEAGSCSND